MCVVGLVVSALGFLAGYCAWLWIPFDVFNHLTVHFLILGASCIVGLFLRRFSFSTALCLALLGSVGIGVYGRYGTSAPTDLITSPAHILPLKVMTFNAFYGTDNWEEMAEEIERQDPDVVSIVEFSPTDRKLSASLKARWPHQVICAEYPACDFAFFSKIPIEEWSKPSDVPSGGRLSPFFKVQLAGAYKGLVLVGVHTSRAPYFRIQKEQLSLLKEYVNSIEGEKIVMGDFNATPFSRVNKEFVQLTHLKRITNLPSWPSVLNLPQLSIDHIFISEGIEVLSAPYLGSRAGSDHYPVLTILGIPEP